MYDITFSKVRKGYSIEEVDQYITLLQDNYKKMDASRKSHEDEVQKFQEKEKQGEIQIEKLQSMIKKHEADYAELEERQKTFEEQQRGLQDQLRIERTEFSTVEKRLKEQLEKKEKEQSGSSHQQGMLRTQYQKEIQSFQERYDRLKGEYDALKVSSDQLTERVAYLEAEALSPGQKDEVEQLSDLFIQAQKQAAEYVETMKSKSQEKMDRTEEERQEIIANAYQEAEKIKEDARREKYEELENEKQKLIREKEEILSKCDMLQKEAQAERANAEREAENILYRANLKLELAEKKDHIIVEGAQKKAQRIEADMTIEYQKLRERLLDSVNRMKDLFEYIADIENVDNIKQYTKDLEDERLITSDEHSDGEK